jgi:hypothetical protein
MATEHATAAILADQIAALKETLSGQAPAEVLTAYDREIVALVRSGLAASGLHEGALAPDLTLPNVDDRPVTLSALLRPVRAEGTGACCSCAKLKED